MNAFDDTDLKNDVERLKAKWFGGAPKRSNLDDEERAIAARLLGSKEEADRLANTKTGDRYRYRRPVVSAHYGYMPAMLGDWRTPRLPDYWYIDMFKNGRKYDFLRGEKSECMAAVARLERMGVPTMRVGKENPPIEPSPKEDVPSRRRQMLEQAGRFTKT